MMRDPIGRCVWSIGQDLSIGTDEAEAILRQKGDVGLAYLQCLQSNANIASACLTQCSDNDPETRLAELDFDEGCAAALKALDLDTCRPTSGLAATLTVEEHDTLITGRQRPLEDDRELVCGMVQ